MSKKFIIKSFIILLLIQACIILIPYEGIQAIESTSYTYTISVDNSRYIRTRDAFIPAGTYLKEIGLSSPEDMYLAGRKLYIADSGNSRIVIFDLDSGEIRYLGSDLLKTPTGVAVSPDGRIYIADYGASEVVVLSASGDLKRRITRPEAAFYGENPYKPIKIDLDDFGNIFVVSEGTHEGILQFDKEGNFTGFFGSNKTKPLSIVEWFQKLTYTEEQKAKLFFRTPPNIVNLYSSDEDVVYSVTQNDRLNAIKKLNMAGVNIFKENSIKGNYSYVDITVSRNGFFFAVAQDGRIDEFSNGGIFVHTFGGQAVTTDRNGLLAVASSIEIDDMNNLYLLDKERGVLQIWFPTEYTGLIHSAEDSFMQGDYDTTLKKWEEILKIDPMAYIAHEGYARTLFQLGRYEEAAGHYEQIYMGKGYSDCYWEIRSEWSRNNMQSILIAIFAVAIILIAEKLLEKKYSYRKRAGKTWRKIKDRYPIIGHLVSDPLYVIRHPVDSAYYVKRGEKGSMAGAAILYITAYLVYMLSRAATPFIFGGGFGIWNDPVSISLIVILPMVLFVFGSYLISSINDGEGTLKQSFMVMGYSLSPYILFWPILALISNFMTLTEIFTYDLLRYLIIFYTGFLFFIAIKETHMYSIKKTTANVLLTLALMLIVIIAVIILFILWRELGGFVSDIIEEVSYRVFK